MMNLIVGYRLIIQNSNPSQNVDDTKMLLEQMVEAVRRLCHRSPILFRMSTRVKIIHSKNTRYGVNHGRRFTTLMTSRGIQEIISKSAAYYSALYSDEQAQKFIRPRFLQMLVLLLSLLNDDDLHEIKHFLEETFEFKADRPNLELLLLKVIPFYSINSKVFLTGLVPAYEGYTPREPDNGDYAHYWDTFITRLLANNYLLPSIVDNLGRERLSWVPKWPDGGFKSSGIFQNLQFSGDKKPLTFNEIPPFEELIDKEDNGTPLTVVLTNEEKHSIRVCDYEPIVCLTSGLYSVQETGTNRRYDLVISEEWLNEATRDAMQQINIVIKHINSLLVKPLGRSRSVKYRITRFRNVDIAVLDETRISGRLTKHTAVLGNDLLAVAYKLDGRKINLSDAVGIMSQDNQEIESVIGYYEHRMPNAQSYGIDNETFRSIRQSLTDVTARLRSADSIRQRLSQDPTISDEPIANVLQAAGTKYFSPPIWYDYRVWTSNQSQMQIEARKTVVTEATWLREDVIQVQLSGDRSKYYVTTLEHVGEGRREDQIQTEDIAILAGSYMLIAEPDEEEGSSGLFLTNYLRVSRPSLFGIRNWTSCQAFRGGSVHISC
jgi:hypothetical protein